MDYVLTKVELQILTTAFAPVVLDCPPLEFRDRHERDRHQAPIDVLDVAIGVGAALDEERNYIRVSDHVWDCHRGQFCALIAANSVRNST